MTKVNVDLTVGSVSCKECQYFDYEISYCTLFEKVINDCCRCKSCLLHEVKEIKETNKIFNKIQGRCNLDLDLEEFKNFKQIRNKLADTEKNLAIAQDEREMYKRETNRLSVENTALKQQLADLQANTAMAIEGMYKGHFSAQAELVRYLKREFDKICTFIENNDTEIKK